MGIYGASDPSAVCSSGSRAGPAGSTQEKLFVALLMAVLPQPFLAFVRRDLMALPFLTTRHDRMNLMMKILLQ
jgi:hypothetical protein